jgi:tripartite-type tricarboxylate transporter receptor subunit TctC
MRKLLLALLISVGSAQAFPTKPVRIIVAFPPGGGTDIVARLIAPRLGETWGQPVIVENRAGAAGVIGTEAAAKSEPDGHTLFMATMGNMTANQHLYNMAVDPLRAFAPITKVVDVHFVFMANPGLPANNVQELIALARSKPGEIAYSSSGAGGAPHLAMELFKRQAGVDLTHVPYKGSSPSITDLIGGRVMLSMDSLVQSLPHIKSGRLKALAVLGPKRAALLPDVPTVAESGLPGYESSASAGMFAPLKTPARLITLLNREIVKVLNRQEVKDVLARDGTEVVGSSPQEFAAAIDAEMATMGKVIKAAGIRTE